MGKPQSHYTIVTGNVYIFRHLARIAATFFYVGYLPLIPGTFGSAAGLAVVYLAHRSFILHAGITAVFLIIGFAVGTMVEAMCGKKDPRCIVIDEVCGILIVFLGVPFTPRLAALGFFLFRLLDTFKPYPAGFVQKYKGSVGIMCDDIIAALYANLILQFVWRLNS